MTVQTRLAQPSDADFIHSLSARVQDALTRAGSLQEIGPIEPPVIARRIEQQEAYLALADGRRVGSVFLEPLSVEQGAAWGIAPDGQRFLSKLMVEPSERGKGYGAALVRALQHALVEQGGGIVLDCWAGNDKLRQLYEGLGFQLHGVFAEEDYHIAVYRWSP